MGWTDLHCICHFQEQPSLFLRLIACLATAHFPLHIFFAYLLTECTFSFSPATCLLSSSSRLFLISYYFTILSINRTTIIIRHLKQTATAERRTGISGVTTPPSQKSSNTLSIFLGRRCKRSGGKVLGA